MASQREILHMLRSALQREWKVGERCRAYRGDAVTTVSRVEGDIVYLENGDSMHWSRMRRVPAGRN